MKEIENEVLQEIVSDENREDEKKLHTADPLQAEGGGITPASSSRGIVKYRKPRSVFKNC